MLYRHDHIVIVLSQNISLSGDIQWRYCRAMIALWHQWWWWWPSGAHTCAEISIYYFNDLMLHMPNLTYTLPVSKRALLARAALSPRSTPKIGDPTAAYSIWSSGPSNGVIYQSNNGIMIYIQYDIWSKTLPSEPILLLKTSTTNQTNLYSVSGSSMT